jgi:hypothetical protein
VVAEKVYKAVREILDKEGVVGVPRVIYYGFALKLQRLLRETPREDWGEAIEGLITWYHYSQMAKKTVLRRIAKALTRH